MAEYHLSEDDLRKLLEQIAIEPLGMWGDSVSAMCPFHHNIDSPSFAIALKPGHPWQCFSGKCLQKGNIVTLLSKKGYTDRELKRLLLANEMRPDDFISYIDNILKEEEEKANASWYLKDIEGFREQDMLADFPARTFLEARSIKNSTYDFFEMGYSAAKHMLVIPASDHYGNYVGIIGRSLAKKLYQYSQHFPRAQHLWSLDKFKREDTIVLTEGSLDAAKVWQATGMGACAVYGSSMSAQQVLLVQKYFKSIILCFDNDEAGKQLTNDALLRFTSNNVFLARYEDGIKDPGELDDIAVAKMFQDPISGLDYLLDDILE